MELLLHRPTGASARKSFAFSFEHRIGDTLHNRLDMLGRTHSFASRPVTARLLKQADATFATMFDQSVDPFRW
jgi:hypothetical protein